MDLSEILTTHSCHYAGPQDMIWIYRFDFSANFWVVCPRGQTTQNSLKNRISKFILSATSFERAWIAANSLKIVYRSDQPFKSYGRKCALARNDFFVARSHLLAELYLNVSRPCATCRIMETRESVQNFAPSPKSRFWATYWAARQRALPAAMQQDFCQHPGDVAVLWLDYCSWRWFSDFGKFESCQEVRQDSVLGSSETWVVVFASFWGYPGFGVQRCGNGLLWTSQHWMLYQRYDLVARAKPKQIQKLTWVCGVYERTPTRSVVTDSSATLRGPTPPPMAASGLVLGVGSEHRQNGHENVKKIVNAFVWLLGGSHTVALCRKFEFFRSGKPVSEAQEFVNHVLRASIVAGVCGETFTQIHWETPKLRSIECHMKFMGRLGDSHTVALGPNF